MKHLAHSLGRAVFAQHYPPTTTTIFGNRDSVLSFSPDVANTSDFGPIRPSNPYLGHTANPYPRNSHNILIGARTFFRLRQFSEIRCPVLACCFCYRPQISRIYIFSTFDAPSSIVCLFVPIATLVCSSMTILNSHTCFSGDCRLVSPASFCSRNFLTCLRLPRFSVLL